MAGLTGKITKFLATPQGRRLTSQAVRKAQQLAQNPQTRARVQRLAQNPQTRATVQRLVTQFGQRRPGSGPRP